MRISLFGRDLISILDVSKSEIVQLIDQARRIKQSGQTGGLEGKILACCFFEPSTRTRLTFEAAMLRGGGSVIGFSDSANTSIKKGESLSDTMRVIGNMCDVVAIRHPMDGSARAAADAARPPVINAGDGSREHPTQALIDLFTMWELQGKIDGLHIALTGDLKYSRTIHSLALAFAHFSPRLYFCAPTELAMPEEIAAALKQAGVKFSYHDTLTDILPKLDILYMTRRQADRSIAFDKTPFIVKENMLGAAKPTLRILHPLPRLEEIDPAIDQTPFAAYFEQAENGLFVRQALLLSILKEDAWK